MARFFKKREETKGLSPGSLVFIGNKKVDNIRIRIIDYDGAQLKEDELKDIAQGAEIKRTNTVTWINVDGLHDLALMKDIGSTFDLHPLLLDSELINDQTVPFLKDLQDLITQAAEAIDTYRDMLSDQLNLYNSVVSNRMNDIMKVLTIFAAIFIPLTFIAGIYGTNFEYLPELKFKYSYFVFWGVMLGVALVMLTYFRRKKWL